MSLFANFFYLTLLCHAAFRVLSCSCGDSSAPIVHYFHQFDPLCHVAFRVFACSCGDPSAPMFTMFINSNLCVMLHSEFSHAPVGILRPPLFTKFINSNLLCHVAFRVFSCSGGDPSAPMFTTFINSKICVMFHLEFSHAPVGKQRVHPPRRPSGIFYTANSGIWQTVWLEPVGSPAPPPLLAMCPQICPCHVSTKLLYCPTLATAFDTAVVPSYSCLFVDKAAVPSCFCKAAVLSSSCHVSTTHCTVLFVHCFDTAAELSYSCHVLHTAAVPSFPCCPSMKLLYRLVLAGC